MYCTLSRFGGIKSISSIKMTASSKAFRRLLAISQSNLLMPLMRKKKAHVSFATARAMKVLTVPGGTEHLDATRVLDTDGLEKLRVTQGEFDQFTNAGHLLAAATNVVVTDVGEVGLLVLALHGIAL